MSKKDKQYTIYIRSTKESIPVNNRCNIHSFHPK